ncbi:Uncharacterized protein TCM_010238 [Theobroma cacao]|uniref:Uncharacterized protein n=1 Tax=Theobroma cacao TaxID=3641 RepID=A0A061E5S5_THECC|nr:Uncharacterized protein TCM_010238 [Theobroma cacao]
MTKLNEFDVPWLVRGDFNVVKCLEEKIGTTLNDDAINQFVNFIEDVSLIDLLISGGKFTWSNNREEASFSCIDRFLMALKILEICPSLQQECLRSHCPSASHLQPVTTLSLTLPISSSKSLALATYLRFSLPNLHPTVPIAIIHRHRTFSRSPLWHSPSTISPSKSPALPTYLQFSTSYSLIRQFPSDHPHLPSDFHHQSVTTSALLIGHPTFKVSDTSYLAYLCSESSLAAQVTVMDQSIENCINLDDDMNILNKDGIPSQSHISESKQLSKKAKKETLNV